MRATAKVGGHMPCILLQDMRDGGPPEEHPPSAEGGAVCAGEGTGAQTLEQLYPCRDDTAGLSEPVAAAEPQPSSSGSPAAQPPPPRLGPGSLAAESPLACGSQRSTAAASIRPLASGCKAAGPLPLCGQSPAAAGGPQSRPPHGAPPLAPAQSAAIRCGRCTVEMRWSCHSGAGYERGWWCSRCRRSGGGGTFRWFCRGCEDDVCGACHPGPPPAPPLWGEAALREPVAGASYGEHVADAPHPPSMRGGGLRGVVSPKSPLGCSAHGARPRAMLGLLGVPARPPAHLGASGAPPAPAEGPVAGLPLPRQAPPVVPWPHAAEPGCIRGCQSHTGQPDVPAISPVAGELKQAVTLGPQLNADPPRIQPAAVQPQLAGSAPGEELPLPLPASLAQAATSPGRWAASPSLMVPWPQAEPAAILSVEERITKLRAEGCQQVQTVRDEVQLAMPKERITKLLVEGCQQVPATGPPVPKPPSSAALPPTRAAGPLAPPPGAPWRPPASAEAA
ncbi:unnamed protein product, partial [Prorocentrum cordatum]